MLNKTEIKLKSIEWLESTLIRIQNAEGNSPMAEFLKKEIHRRKHASIQGNNSKQLLKLQR